METKDYLKKLRKEKGLSARQLSEIFNLEESAISEIERGKKTPSLKRLIIIAEKLEIKIEKLFIE